MSTLRLGILCSCFDPIHSDDILLARSALKHQTLDHVLLVLMRSSSSQDCQAAEGDRWKMTVAACAGDQRLVPSRIALDASFSPRSAKEVLRLVKSSMPKADPVLLEEASSSAVRETISADIRASFASGRRHPALQPSVWEYCSALGLYHYPDSLEHAEAWIPELFQALNPHRFAHSLSVADQSRQLAVRYGADALKAEQAGLLHDCAKCFPLKEMQSIVLDAHASADPEMLSSGALLHSVAGACYARKHYGITDPDVLKAIEYHNTGYPGMSRLAMVVCLADYIEPNREPFPLLDEVRRLSGTSLDKALLLSLEGTSEHVLSKGKFLHPRTRDTIQWLRSLSETH